LKKSFRVSRGGRNCGDHRGRHDTSLPQRLVVPKMRALGRIKLWVGPGMVLDEFFVGDKNQYNGQFRTRRESGLNETWMKFGRERYRRTSAPKG